MKKAMSEKFVRRAIKDWLFKSGWNWNYTEKETREKGVDIRVQDGRNKKHARYFFEIRHLPGVLGRHLRIFDSGQLKSNNFSSPQSHLSGC